MVSFNVLSKEVNKVKSKDIFKNLKSDYFLQILFNNLMKKKTLDIIKYNKNIKNRININIKDYKEYSEIYSSIEIEITLLKVNMVNLLILTKKIKCIYIFILMITKKKLKEIIKIKMKKLKLSKYS